jgi:replicative DNA helicase
MNETGANNPRGKDNRSRNSKANNEQLSAQISGKVPPQAIPLEEAVLGAIMLDRDALPLVMDILKPSSFYLDSHQLIYEAAIRLFEKSIPIDLMTITEELKKMGSLENMGGAYYLVELTNRVASSANIEYHARILAQKQIQRDLIQVSTKTIRDAYEDTTDVFDLLDEAEKGLFAINQNNLSRSFESMGSLTGQVMKQVEELSKKTDGLTGVPSGFTDLDRLTSGWQPSDLIILAARPGMGKCLGKGTGVIMADGRIRKVEDLQVGDLLMGDDSTPRRILSTTTGIEQMYWIRQQHGIDYRVNESHILCLKPPHDLNSDVLEISVKDWLNLPEPVRNLYRGYKAAYDLPAATLGSDPYLVGWIWGDAALWRREHHEPESEGYQLVAIRQNIHATACRIGALPGIYLRGSRTQRLALLSGVLDAGARITERGMSLRIADAALLPSLRTLCNSLGFGLEIRTDTHPVYGSAALTLDISGALDTLSLRSGRTPNSGQAKGRCGSIVVVKDSVDAYFGFELDGNGRFLLEDTTVTHNTSLVLSIALNAARDFKKGVALFSLEMANTQLVSRLLSMDAEIPGSKMRTGKLEQYEVQQLQSALDRVGNVPIYIDDTPAINIFELRSKCRRMKMQHDIQLIIIDYLQLMSGGTENNKNGNREQEIAGISRALKGLAKELKVPVIALAQLSRAGR